MKKLLLLAVLLVGLLSGCSGYYPSTTVVHHVYHTSTAHYHVVHHFVHHVTYHIVHHVVVHHHYHH